jgi:hypothetical protein
LVPAPAPAVIATLDDCKPAAVGLNTTMMVQVVPAATVLPQSEVSLYWLVLPPLSAIFVMGSAIVPVLFKAIVRLVLVLSGSLPKASVAGVSV